MGIVNEASLADTLNRLNEAFFYAQEIAVEEKTACARWLASRQGLHGSYAGMFAPTEDDTRRAIRLFPGETVASRAAARHVLAEETSRAILLLGINEANITQAWHRADGSMQRRLREYEVTHPLLGMYCCGVCSTAYWRNLAAGGINRQAERLAAGMAVLKARRQDDGGWGAFPFYPTLLALLDIDLSAAKDEMRYAAPQLAKKLKRLTGKDKYALRRKTLAERVLARV